ncbi:DUF2490 domain-containing protein [Salibacter halophilus]|uniref:DUF2490 domain-containing protein n=1 Tax=Salibacter halophilus TaxID=1803916 RepID=A0A6N6MAN1_9FLAO|nr:DUF2490 domain-containing protein [Salibacter halophilus]KAB1065497.1 DUF2490 domain-containing protein [Salibacter halophilus]
MINHLKIVIHSVLILLISSTGFSQEQELEPSFGEMGYNTWLSSYNKFQLTDKLYWAAEMHYRRAGEASNTPFVDRMSKIYNRHGLNYVFSNRFNITAGGVLRLDFTPEPGNTDYEYLIIEPRIWHQYLFAIPFSRFMVYHRFRIEHRWTRGFEVGDTDWQFRNRWRYNFYMKIPLNNKQLKPGTIYLSPSIETIAQTGKSVVGSFIEDIRFYTNVGYIASPRVSSSVGMMYTTGQNLNDPTHYRRRWVFRVSAYISLDFRKEEEKIPSIKLSD